MSHADAADARAPSGAPLPVTPSMENLCDLLLFTRRKAGYDDANTIAPAGALHPRRTGGIPGALFTRRSHDGGPAMCGIVLTGALAPTGWQCSHASWRGRTRCSTTAHVG